MNYFWMIEDDTCLRLLIEITSEFELIEQLIFDDMLSKILYETKFRKSYKNAKIEQDYKELIKDIERPRDNKGGEDVDTLSE